MNQAHAASIRIQAPPPAFAAPPPKTFQVPRAAAHDPDPPMGNDLVDAETLITEIPEQMQRARRWLLWRLEHNGNKPTKVPYYVMGARRQGILDTPGDQARLVDMAEALCALAQSRFADYRLGFALGPDGTGKVWQGVDFDHVQDHPGLDLLVEDAPGYVERSPSGDGFHVLGYGQPFASLGNNSSGIEAYAGGRYFTVTGEAIRGDLVDLADYVTTTLAPRHGGSKPDTPATDRAPLAVTPEQVKELRSALNAIPAEDYGTWVSMGHALAELGNVGKELWLTWSQTSDKWQPVDAHKWRTFVGEYTGFQAVFAEAQRHGWVNPLKGTTAPATAAATSILSAVEIDRLLSWATRTQTPLPDAGLFTGPPQQQGGKPTERHRVTVIEGSGKSAPWRSLLWVHGQDGFMDAVEQYLIHRANKVERENAKAMDAGKHPQGDIPPEELRAHASSWLAGILALAVTDEQGGGLLARLPAVKGAIDPDTDWLSEPPKATAAMFYGLVGDIAKAGAKGREVSPVSVALAFISYLSAQVGRDLYIPIGDARHPLHLYTLHVGRTAMGGKGESVAITTRIDAVIRADQAVVEDQNLSVHLLGQVHTGGLSSREGLTYFVHDGFIQGKDEIPAIEDKRLWVFEPEFVNVLAQGKRDGNTLSSALRDVWDGGSIKPATKSSRIWATEPHIGLHGCITPGELLHSLEAREITNGFGNRFLICWAERTCLIPDPQPTHLDVVTTLAARLREILTWATGTYPMTKYNRAMTFTPQAEALWHQSYASLKSRDTTSDTITALLERRAPITRRLAALFAATDLTTQVDVHHLEAAIAWANYHRDSVEFIFGADAQERQTASEASENRRKITDYLTGREWVLRSELYSKALAKRADAKELDIALQGLLADNRIEKRTEGRNGSAPNTKTLYRIIL